MPEGTYEINVTEGEDKVSVYKSSDQILDCEAVRVIQMLPKWKPGTIKGESVNCYYMIPVAFSLQ